MRANPESIMSPPRLAGAPPKVPYFLSPARVFDLPAEPSFLGTGDFDADGHWDVVAATRGDSGLYLRGTPQVQIWDTARANVGAQVGSGGLYNNKKNPAKPTLRKCKKQGMTNRKEGWFAFFEGAAL